MGQGLQYKECHNYILHPGLEFSAAWYGLQKIDKAAKFLGKAGNKLQGQFLLCHAHIFMRSTI